MVEFCPKCGSILIPERRKGKVMLVCKRCGYVKEGSGSGYKQSQKVDKKSKTKLAVVSGEQTRKLKDEEREMLKEYYETFLRTMEGSEEE